MSPVPASSEQYEALRRHAVERGQVFSAEPLGMMLVVKTGLASWMRQWQEISSAPAGTQEPGWQHDLTRLLAQMTARQLRPRSAA
jgi:hypothetical protein